MITILLLGALVCFLSFGAGMLIQRRTSKLEIAREERAERRAARIRFLNDSCQGRP